MNFNYYKTNYTISVDSDNTNVNNFYYMVLKNNEKLLHILEKLNRLAKIRIENEKFKDLINGNGKKI